LTNLEELFWREFHLDGEAREFPCLQKDSCEHGAVEAACVGVAQRRVVCGQQVQAVGEKIVGAVGEAVVGFAGDDAGFEEEGKVSVERNFAETDDDADARESLDFIGKMGGAVTNLLWERLVSGRSAADYGADPCVAELETVIAGDGVGFGGEAKLVEDGIHEVARAVAGEGTASSVGSVGSGSEAEDEDSRAGVAEAGDGASPVGLVLVGAAFGFADTLAVGTKAGAAIAGNDCLMNLP
jgi:hypothetical protein